MYWGPPTQPKPELLPRGLRLYPPLAEVSHLPLWFPSLTYPLGFPSGEQGAVLILQAETQARSPSICPWGRSLSPAWVCSAWVRRAFQVHSFPGSCEARWTAHKSRGAICPLQQKSGV